MTAESPRPAAAAHGFWWACAIAAPPIAFAVAAAGFPMATADPLRDLGAIALWSVAEEIVFRGALQPALAGLFERRLGWRWNRAVFTPANLLTSALFAAFHLWRHPVAVAIGVFPVSLVYGRARELSGRWWPAALLHVWFNVLLYAASGPWLLSAGR
ncbi:MAG: CPBP family intramembrane metalloprotease [Burkholderiales bacterium]|nr:CPBP family intramembrane metalloprotease [Burkholderiales bacterium]